MEHHVKTGLVVEGGGMKCAYNAGILDAFIDHGISFDYCIGVSGGAGNLATYLAGQRGRNIRFFTDHIHSPDYFGLRSLARTGNLFGLKYIYCDLSSSAGADPFDFPAFMANPADYRAVVTNALTGKAEYFGREMLKLNDYRLFMASSAIPVVSRPVVLNGTPYFDGGISDAIPVRRALEDGCEKLVVILSKTRDYIRKPQSMRAVYSAVCRKYPNIIKDISTRHERYNRNFRDVFELERAGKAFVFAPSCSVHVGTYSMDEKAERELYELGFSDFDARAGELRRFLADE